MKECWLSPYGEVVYTGGEWAHAETAAKIIFERYNNGKYETRCDVWCDFDYDETPTERLEKLGWVKFSTITNGWVVNNESGLTTDQKDKIFDLTGDIFE